jgi:hypothetical protein
VRPARAAGAAGSPILFFAMAMAMAGRIGGAQWRSAPPLAGSYGVDVDSTRLRRAHGVGLTSSVPLIRAREARPRGELARRAASGASRGRRRPPFPIPISLSSFRSVSEEAASSEALMLASDLVD